MSSSCPQPPRPLPPPISSRAPPAILTSARSISATASSRGNCWSRSWRRSSITRSRRAEATLEPAQMGAAAGARPIASLRRSPGIATGRWCRRAGSLAQQGTIDEQTLKAQRGRGLGRSRRTSRAQEAQLQVLHRAEDLCSASSRRSTASSPNAMSMLAAWCRPMRPSGTFMFDDHAEQRHPDPGVRAAGLGVRSSRRASMRSVHVPELPRPRRFPAR